MKKHHTAAHITIVIVILYLLTPLLFTATYSVFEKWTGLLPEGFTLKHYVELLTEEDFMLSLWSPSISPGWKSTSRSSA